MDLRLHGKENILSSIVHTGPTSGQKNSRIFLLHRSWGNGKWDLFWSETLLQWPHFGVLSYFSFGLLQQLFLDDARIKNFTSCFKDKQFLRFFFKRLRFNATQRYQNEFPYLSLCGTERNYVRCDDLPIVFTEMIANDKGKWKLGFK